MKRLKWILVLGVLLPLFQGCQTNQIGNRFADENIRLLVRGTPGLSYVGSYRAEGHLKKIQGTVPDEINVQAGSFFCELLKANEEGELSINVMINEKPIGHASTDRAQGGIRVYRNYITWSGKVLNSISGI